MTVKLTEYQIIETGSRPRISGSRAYVHDVLDAMNDGYTLYEISDLYNLSPRQVKTAFAYIDEHHDRLQDELAEIIRISEQRQRETNALMEKVRAEIRSQPMTPEQKVFYEWRDKWIADIRGQSRKNGNGKNPE